MKSDPLTSSMSRVRAVVHEWTRQSRFHVGGVVIAICICCLHVFPQFFAASHAGGAFRGVFPQPENDAVFYLARVQEVYDGHTKFTQPFLYEGKDGLPLQFWLPEVMVARMGMLFSVDAQHALIISDALFPFLLALCTYAIVFLLTASRLASVVAVALLFLGLYNDIFGRPISPQVVLVPMLGFMLAALALERRRTWSAVVVAGIFFGSLFHAYAYYWMYATVLLGMWGALLVVCRAWGLVVRVAGVALIGFGIGIPYFVGFLQALQLPSYHETMARLGMIATHMPSGVLIVALAGVYCAVCILWFLFSRHTWQCDERFLLVSSMVVAVPIVANQHLITGHNLEFSSHYRLLSIFVTVFGLLFLGVRFTQNGALRIPRTLWVFASGACIAVCAGVGMQHAYANSFLDQRTIGLQRYAPVFAWLNTNTDRDAVVYANRELSALIPAYTHNNVFFAREANMHFMSDYEVATRFLANMYFEPTLSDETIRTHERSLFGTYYINRSQHAAQNERLRRLLGFSTEHMARYPEEAFAGLGTAWVSNEQRTFAEVVAPYRVDYVLWDRRQDPAWEAKLAPLSLTPVYDDGGLTLYRVR